MRTHTSLSRVLIRATAAGLVLLTIVSGVVHAADPVPPALRCTTPELNDLVQQGLVRSPTLRSLVVELERAQVIAYVFVSRNLPSGTAGRMRFLGAGGGWRFIGIEVDDRRTRVDFLALLGHELQHAAEIAAAPEVVDTASLTTFYDRVGHRTGMGIGDALTFETQAAIDTGRRVYGELFGNHW